MMKAATSSRSSWLRLCYALSGDPIECYPEDDEDGIGRSVGSDEQKLDVRKLRVFLARFLKSRVDEDRQQGGDGREEGRGEATDEEFFSEKYEYNQTIIRKLFSKEDEEESFPLWRVQIFLLESGSINDSNHYNTNSSAIGQRVVVRDVESVIKDSCDDSSNMALRGLNSGKDLKSSLNSLMSGCQSLFQTISWSWSSNNTMENSSSAQSDNNSTIILIENESAHLSTSDSSADDSANGSHVSHASEDDNNAFGAKELFDNVTIVRRGSTFVKIGIFLRPTLPIWNPKSIDVFKPEGWKAKAVSFPRFLPGLSRAALRGKLVAAERSPAAFANAFHYDPDKGYIRQAVFPVTFWRRILEAERKRKPEDSGAAYFANKTCERVSALAEWGGERPGPEIESPNDTVKELIEYFPDMLYFDAYLDGEFQFPNVTHSSLQVLALSNAPSVARSSGPEIFLSQLSRAFPRLRELYLGGARLKEESTYIWPRNLHSLQLHNVLRQGDMERGVLDWLPDGLENFAFDPDPALPFLLDMYHIVVYRQEDGGAHPFALADLEALCAKLPRALRRLDLRLILGGDVPDRFKLIVSAYTRMSHGYIFSTVPRALESAIRSLERLELLKLDFGRGESLADEQLEACCVARGIRLAVGQVNSSN